MKELGFKEYQDGWLFMRTYHPFQHSNDRDSWEMIITVSKDEFVNKATFDVVSIETRVPYDVLMNDGGNGMADNRGELILNKFNEIAEGLRELGTPFYMTGDEVIVEDKVETKVVCIDLDKPLMVGVSPRPKLGLASNGKISDRHTNNPAVMFKGKGEVNYVWRNIFELRRVIRWES